MTPKECEELFQKSLRTYRFNQSKTAWDTIWTCVLFCCSNISKSKLGGVKCPDLDGKIMDATIKVINKIKEGTDPKRLSSFCYLYCIGELYNRKLQREERNISYEAWLEYQYANEEE